MSSSICKVFSGVLAAVLITAVVRAEEKIAFKKDGFSDAEWVGVREYFLAEHPFLIKFVAEDQTAGKEQALDIIRRDILYVGRFDLNDDGSAELLVYVMHGYECGSAGCNTIILEKRDGLWEEIGSTIAHFHIINGPDLTVTDEISDGYRRIRGSITPR